MTIMGKKLKRKKTTAELPEELVRREILTRLPIKSAVRFKCVSKSWLSLFSGPKFVKEHLTRNSTQNPNDFDCLVARKHTNMVILSRFKETFALPSARIDLVGSVRGLVCLCHGDKLSLWNPAIHQSKEFTLPPSCCGDQMEFKGFGFDPLSDNYKVVVLARNLRSATVYYSNSDSWINLLVPENVYVLQDRGKISNSCITTIKDCPYWTFHRYKHNRHPDEQRQIVSTTFYLTAVKFDTGSNEFNLLPEFHFDLNLLEGFYGFSYQFVDMNDCLTLIVDDWNSSKSMLDIYSLNGEEGFGVWSKMYTFGPLKFGLGCVSQGFHDGDEILLHNHGLFSCYDHKTDTIKRVSTTSTTGSVVSCFRYTPSLAFLEGMKSVYLPTQTRHATGLCSRVPRRLINSLKK
ncbi:putative F-box protein At1g19160 [Apium graveolens]|uniref:putative F-box protein At1g19160 n=1 Tax=Apium graveolens TaxID=4045 RepID=UPI003D7B6157